MDHPHSSNPPVATRRTLRLKEGARQAGREDKRSAVPPPTRESKVKAGAQWSDEYRERMQADMDALTSEKYFKR